MFNFSNWHCFLTKVFPHLFYTSHHKGARNVCKSNRNMAVDDTEFPCHEKLSCVLIFIYFWYRKVWQVLHFQHVRMYTSCIDHTSDIIFWYHSSVERSYRYYYFSFFFFEKKINLHSLLLIHKLKSTELTSNKELPVKSICNIK